MYSKSIKFKYIFKHGTKKSVSNVPGPGDGQNLHEPDAKGDVLITDGPGTGLGSMEFGPTAQCLDIQDITPVYPEVRH